MFTLHEVSTGVCTRITELIETLEPFSEREPWVRLRVEDRTNALPHVVDLACALAFSRARQKSLCRAVVEAAAHHGTLRREQGVPESTLFEELALVRNALWADLQARYGRDCDAVTEAILKVDTALSLASQASLRGFFRLEFEQRGTWEEALLELETDWLRRNPIFEWSGGDESQKHRGRQPVRHRHRHPRHHVNE